MSYLNNLLEFAESAGRRNKAEEGEEELDEDNDDRAAAAAHAVQQGGRWYHTYLYVTNVDEKERERLMTRPLLY